jgi:hypothetical protein
MIKKPNSHAPNGKLRGGRLQPNGSREHVYTPEIAAEICRRVSLGETLTAVCKSLDFDVATVRDWFLGDRDGFAQAYARARVSQAESWSDAIVAVAEDATLEPNDRRVRIDTKKWLMSKLYPSRYGDKIVHAGDPATPIAHVVGVVDLERLSGPELDALERFTEARLAAQDVRDQPSEIKTNGRG